MNTFLMIPGAIFSLQSFELFLIVILAITLGYAVKWIVDKYRLVPGKEVANDLQQKLEHLQNKFNSELLRKDEAEALLQDELKGAENRHIELQVQYAKALTYIEQLRQGKRSDTTDVETEVGQQILQNLQDKIARQERSLLELEQQLRETEKEKVRLKDAIDQLSDSNISQQQTHGAATEREQALEEEIEQLKQRLGTLENTTAPYDSILEQKAGITATRVHATQVAEKVEEFRDHLTAILRDTYSYEQLLASNERLNENISRLQTEKRMAEQEIAELQQVANEKLKLQEQVELVNTSLEQKKSYWTEKLQQFETSLATLSKQVEEKEKTIADFVREREELSLQIELLQHKLEEREQLSREMLLAIKDIESRFAHVNYATESAVVTNEGEMQYR
jgi:chromosome segregation ATPase